MAAALRKWIAQTLLLLFTATAFADSNTAIDPIAAVRVSQAAIGRTLPDYRFTDSNGNTLQLSKLRGRPVVVSFVYTSCAFICPMITTRLKQVSELAAETLGTNSFTVLTIGFDTAVDTPDRMRDYARARRIDAPNWHFVSADAETVAAMSHDLGFQFVPLAGGFDHLAQVSVLDAQSRVYAQIYGPEFDTPALIDPLKRLSLGANVRERPLAEVLRKARLLCTTFDPKTGRYSFDYSLIMEIVIGFTITLSIGGWWLHSWRHR